jgi:hypothetical protein
MENHAYYQQKAFRPECVGLVARPVFKTGLRPCSRLWRFDSPAFRF